MACASWDKTIRIYAFDRNASGTATSPLVRIADAATDHIKAVAYDHQSKTLVTGGSDLHVRAWDLEPLLSHVAELEDAEWLQLVAEGKGRKGADLPTMRSLGILRAHTRPITKIVPLVHRYPEGERSHRTGTIFSGDSLGRVLESRLCISGEGKDLQATFNIRRELRGHETSISDMRVTRGIDDSVPLEEESAGTYFKLWTASNDRTAMCFDILPPSWPGAAKQKKPRAQIDRSSKAGPVLGEEPPLLASNVLQHDDYVLSVLPLSKDVVPGEAELVLTGTASEEICVWDEELAQEEAQTNSKIRDIKGNALPSKEMAHQGLLRRREGHWHEVTALGEWKRTKTGPLADAESDEDLAGAGHSLLWVVSASYDGSIRRWPLPGECNTALRTFSNG